MTTLMPASDPSKSHGVPMVVLRAQLTCLVANYDERKQGTILTGDLLDLIDQYEQENQVTLLTQEQRTAIQPFTLANPDLDMSAEDIMNLVKLVSPNNSNQDTPHTSNIPSPSIRPRTSAPLRHIKSLSQRLRTSRSPSLDEPFDIDTKSWNDVSRNYSQPSPTDDSMSISAWSASDLEQEMMDDAEVEQMSLYYQKTLLLTKRLKESERSLASMTHENESRIAHLQTFVDDMNNNINNQKKEILEFKGKEKNSLDQISALEAHIAQIQSSQSDHKQVYVSLKRLVDEKCGETQKLQDALKSKEMLLEQTEETFSHMNKEFRQLMDERDRLVEMQVQLEQELIMSQSAHMKLEEQRCENERLKQVIDELSYDLDEARNSRHQRSWSRSDMADNIKDLQSELAMHYNTIQNPFQGDNDEFVNMVKEQQDATERLRTVENEKDFYKAQANDAMQDLDKVKSELDSLRKALQRENKFLVTELADLRSKAPTTPPPPSDKDFDGHSATSTGSDMNSLRPGVRQRRAERVRRSRLVYDLNDPNAQPLLMLNQQASSNPQPQSPPPSQTIVRKSSVPDKAQVLQLMRKSDDRIVANTITFALYTLVVYAFGIVTSTFLIETSSQTIWNVGNTAGKNKVLEVLLYWLEKLLSE
ncbi:hypothetical protein BC943DRAFT_300761 [Umbelopsis sp. AD052]|nr:hypothetical protein BC943DRAFT_300761 [Umbelopsis sp. AD052]